MNRFVIVDGLPYLLANGKTYSVRWDENGFTVGAEVELTSVPTRTYSQLSVLAKCAGHLDSISAPEATQEQADQVNMEDTTEDTEPEPENTEDTEQDEQPEEPSALDKMSVKELKVYADTFGIDIDGLTKKADILKAIKAVK